MESTGVPGRIQLAQSTRRLLGDADGFTERQIEVKGIGRMTTYLLDGPAV
jgi:class 3 adenylate cyclase